MHRHKDRIQELSEPACMTFGGARQNEGKFVASEARSRHTAPGQRFQSPGDGAKNGITSGMPQLIVDGLEPIEVDQQQRT
jgi:hypothetical protein